MCEGTPIPPTFLKVCPSVTGHSEKAIVDRESLFRAHVEYRETHQVRGKDALEGVVGLHPIHFALVRDALEQPKRRLSAHGGVLQLHGCSKLQTLKLVGGC